MATITASSQSFLLLNPKTPFLSSSSLTPPKPLFFKTPNFSPLKIRVSSSSPSISPIQSNSIKTPISIPPNSSISSSTRTITTLIATLYTISKFLLSKIVSISPNPQTLISSSTPLFFAALKDRPTGYLNTPLTVVAAGMSKWLDIYSGVLMVRVLLSWFPNIPWDRQPLSAIRDLCDPYLNLFRNIIPPIFDTLDVSPLLAFAVLGTLGSILSNSSGLN
uniref:Suaeda glauca YGGT family protein mRNA n=1 Tax=Suaeda glauca TaxID=397272 RepID=A0A0C5AU66_9CARY|nr:YGGT family protein [Suaeda glauca]